MKSRLLGAACACILSLTATSACAALIDNLNGTVTQTRTDGSRLMWSQDANHAGNNLTDARVAEIISAVGSIDGHTLTVSDFETDTFGYTGRMNWWAAMAWVDQLVLAETDDWRLPSMDVNGDTTIVICDGTNGSVCLDNEYGYLYWESGINTHNQTPFNSVQPRPTWSSTPWAPDTTAAWNFDFGDGSRSSWTKEAYEYAWAVRELAPIPIPPALYLFGSGLIALVGMARTRAAKNE